MGTQKIQPLVSVIVPIFKVERYLRICVDSILAQTLREIEVILVDDGSPDACPAIVDEYAAQDTRVVAIHQANGGYGKAVNRGITLAQAPYIGIIESDDWIEPTMYEKLYQRAEATGADIVKSLYWCYDSTRPAAQQDTLTPSPLTDAPDEPFTPKEYIPLMFAHPSIWSNLYKAEIVKQTPFLETASAAYQDGPFIMEIYAKIQSIAVVKEPLVHYRNEPGQNSSSQQKGERCLMVPRSVMAAREAAKRQGNFAELEEGVYRWMYGVCMSFINCAPAYKREYNRLFREAMLPLKSHRGFSYRYFSEEMQDDIRWLLSGHDLPRLKLIRTLTYYSRHPLDIFRKVWNK